MAEAEKKTTELSAGAKVGGPVGLLFSSDQVKNNLTTKLATASLFLEIRFPKVSPRTLEFYTVNFNSVGLSIKNDDLTIGNTKIHLLDIGVLYNIFSPISVNRVKRKWDATFGFGAEHALTKKWSVTFDCRVFFPLDVVGLFTSYGDYTRLIAKEAILGAQTWLGVKKHF